MADTDEQLFLLNGAGAAWEAIGPAVARGGVRVAGGGVFTVFPREDRSFPGYPTVSGLVARPLGGRWTLCTASELTALRLLGQVNRVVTVETGW